MVFLIRLLYDHLFYHLLSLSIRNSCKRYSGFEFFSVNGNSGIACIVLISRLILCIHYFNSKEIIFWYRNLKKMWVGKVFYTVVIFWRRLFNWRQHSGHDIVLWTTIYSVIRTPGNIWMVSSLVFIGPDLQTFNI